MNFTTKIPIQKYHHPITYESKIMLLGSCFATNIGNKFEYFKFQTTINPFGIVFNPVSLAKIIVRSVQKEYYTENDIFFHNDLWHCFEVHSELSHPDKNTFLNSLNELIDTTHQQIKAASHLFITLGTSWVYRNIATNEIVANCHKVAQKEFEKELLTIKTIEQQIETILSALSVVNLNCKLIFTVSPVRHIKDGFAENTLSKAHLITAIQRKIIHHPTRLNYFPAYEIMMDELRDYRFYASDMLHPNETAINYIWEQFKLVWIAENTTDIMNEIETIQKGLAHQPFNSNSLQHQAFLENLKQKMAALKKNYNIDF